jgi:hypothetical protein
MNRLDAPSFTCPVCETTTWHPLDVHEMYCQHCEAWTVKPPAVKHYNMAGEVIPLSRFTEIMDPDVWEAERLVGRDTINGVRISTVLLGLDYSFGIGPPLIFETMIFGGPWDEHTERYPNLDAAKAGHDRACAAARGLLPPLAGNECPAD